MMEIGTKVQIVNNYLNEGRCGKISEIFLPGTMDTEKVYTIQYDESINNYGINYGMFCESELIEKPV